MLIQEINDARYLELGMYMWRLGGFYGFCDVLLKSIVLLCFIVGPAVKKV
jgi:hypothetical protein